MPCLFKIWNFSIHNLYFKLHRFSEKLSKSYFIPYVCCADKIRLYLLIVNKSLTVVSLILKCNINILIHSYEHIVFLFFFYKVLIFNSVSSLINGLLKCLNPQFPDSGSVPEPRFIRLGAEDAPFWRRTKKTKDMNQDKCEKKCLTRSTRSDWTGFEREK
jgi:hypothetical protein